MSKTVIYTAIYGGKDTLIEPAVVPPDCHFVCFTDRPDIRSPIWELRHEDAISKDPVRSAKVFKILPHRYFPDYECSVWVDGNILVRSDVRPLIERYLGDVDIAFFDHRQTKMDPRGSVFDEAAMLLRRAEEGKPKDDPDLIERQMAHYRAEGFPDSGGLIVGMEVIRRHNVPAVAQAMEDWWSEIQNGSRRDQLSFNYVAWKRALPFAYIDGDSRDNPYFLWRPHLR